MLGRLASPAIYIVELGLLLIGSCRRLHKDSRYSRSLLGGLYIATITRDWRLLSSSLQATISHEVSNKISWNENILLYAIKTPL